MKGEYLFTGFAEKEITFGNARGGVSRSYTTTGGNLDFTRPGCMLPNILTCITPTVTTPHPGTFDKVIGRKIMNAIDFQTLRVGLNYRF